MADIDLVIAVLDRFGYLISKSEIYTTVLELEGVSETMLWYCVYD